MKSLNVASEINVHEFEFSNNCEANSVYDFNKHICFLVNKHNLVIIIINHNGSSINTLIKVIMMIHCYIIS